MGQKIKLLIADDHRVLLDGLLLMLQDAENIEVVSSASNGEEVLLKMTSYYVDVLLMDIQMPVMDGYETAMIVAEKYPDTRIIILSMHNERIYIEKMYAAGVMGYLLKSSGREEIIEAIEKVYSGSKYFSADVTSAILDNKATASATITSSELTRREKEILGLITSGMTNPAIAAKLFLSRDTIKTHRKNIMRKLEVKNTAELVKYAVYLAHPEKEAE